MARKGESTMSFLSYRITMHNGRNRTRLLCINMPRLTTQQRVWICVEYARVNNAEEVLRRWRNHWHDVPSPGIRQ